MKRYIKRLLIAFVWLLTLFIGVFLGYAIGFNNQPLVFTGDLNAEANATRLANNLSELKQTTELNKVARSKCNDLVRENSNEHKDANDLHTWEKYSFNYKIVGENISWGRTNARGVIQGWLDSPGHRKNLLNPQFNEVGYAACKATYPDDHYKVVQILVDR